MLLTIYRLLASLIYWILCPVIRLSPSGKTRLWRERLGVLEDGGHRHIWMHAASVGEVKVLGYLIDYLHKQAPSLTIHVTTMTRTGRQTARELLTERQNTVSVSYCPLDAAPAVHRTLDTVKPSLLLFAETEIWPNLVQIAARRGIPVILVNGRMSEKAQRRYRPFSRSFGRVLACYERFFFKTTANAARFRHFGVPDARGTVTGDMKFDAPLPPRSEGRRREIRHRIGVSGEGFLFVAGSTRPGEERILASVYKSLSASHAQFRLVLAPRHLDRVHEIKAMLTHEQLPFSIYGESPEEKTIVIVDRLGILNDLYLAADAAFVGGTLVEIGGHNLLEPVWAGTPVLYGPHVANVGEAASYIEKHNYGARVGSGEELAEMVKRIMDGTLTFTTKTEHDLHQSATATVGRYIMDRLKDVGTRLEEDPAA
ncbi:MAG: glycosyltransferase N-terminal domain-containing protein [Candidatus Zixiibacteriota bacterium]